MKSSTVLNFACLGLFFSLSCLANNERRIEFTSEATHANPNEFFNQCVGVGEKGGSLLQGFELFNTLSCQDPQPRLVEVRVERGRSKLTHTSKQNGEVKTKQKVFLGSIKMTATYELPRDCKINGLFSSSPVSHRREVYILRNDGFVKRKFLRLVRNPLRLPFGDPFTYCNRRVLSKRETFLDGDTIRGWSEWISE